MKNNKAKMWLGGLLSALGISVTTRRAAAIFPALFVEPVRTSWAMPAARYDPERKIAVTENGEPAFGGDSATKMSSSSSHSETDSKMGINRGTDDHSDDSDSD